MQNILEQNLDMATALLAGEKLKELIMPGSSQDEKGGALAGLMVQLKLELPFDRVVSIGTVVIPILLVTLVFTRNFAEESIYCYTPHNFTRDQALTSSCPTPSWPSLASCTSPALGWEFMASTRLTSELNFLLHEIDNCYHRAAEGRAPKIEKQIQSKGPGITERERREIIENAEKEKSPEQNLFEKYLERRGQSNFLAKLYLARHLAIICLSSLPISYLSAYYARQRQNEFTCALGEPPDFSSPPQHRLEVNCKLPAVQLQRIMAAVDLLLLCGVNVIILLNLLHLFVVRKSNFVFDKLHKVGIKTRRRWQKSQFCDINILAMFCNENRDHIKSLNRLDFITNESDPDVRQRGPPAAGRSGPVQPRRHSHGARVWHPDDGPGPGPWHIRPSWAESRWSSNDPRKKIKWIPSSNPLPQPFKEPLTLVRLENNAKPDKLKPVRRKTMMDSFITPHLDSKSTQHPPTSKDLSGGCLEKKHTRNFSLDVQPYTLTFRKPKAEAVQSQPLPQEHGLDSVFIEGTHSVVHAGSASIAEKQDTLSDSSATTFAMVTLPNSSYLNGGTPTQTLPPDQIGQTGEPESQGVAFSRIPTHPLLSIHRTLYEEVEAEEGGVEAGHAG
ncbi:hypothetical protein SKAU_G00046840 [Synaphobranchus kaupii]|uniref:Pannexin-2 n=1 Tax=Synaphobranchus kaupii TaxID=118154 RepID=A0A9Q1G288_SYNKA|nr:hypothetical protein SKAU_G00046840 [Synaphobranchus kaupii]